MRNVQLRVSKVGKLVRVETSVYGIREKGGMQSIPTRVSIGLVFSWRTLTVRCYWNQDGKQL